MKTFNNFLTEGSHIPREHMKMLIGRKIVSWSIRPDGGLSINLDDGYTANFYADRKGKMDVEFEETV